jgi:hypothetical protein
VLDLIGNLRDRLSHRPADMVLDGNPADLGQVPVDLQISVSLGLLRGAPWPSPFAPSWGAPMLPRA